MLGFVRRFFRRKHVTGHSGAQTVKPAPTEVGAGLCMRAEGLGHNSRLAVARLGRGPGSRPLETSGIAPPFESPREQRSLLARILEDSYAR